MKQKTQPLSDVTTGFHDVTKVVPRDAYVTDDVMVTSGAHQTLMGGGKLGKVGKVGKAGKAGKAPPKMYETGHQTYMVLSVVVSVCFNLPVGLLAFFVSVKSSDSFQSGDIPGGRVRARCSLVLSMLGIVMTVTIVMAVVFYIADKHRQMQYSYG